MNLRAVVRVHPFPHVAIFAVVFAIPDRVVIGTTTTWSLEEEASMQKLYVITRTDLPKCGLQAAQAAHAALLYASTHPVAFLEWTRTSNNVVLLGCQNETHLDQLARAFPQAVVFREPDCDDQATALAFLHPGTCKKLSSLPCLLKEPKYVEDC
jgi:peptidyl-tRNA hydrolase